MLNYLNVNRRHNITQMRQIRQTRTIDKCWKKRNKIANHISNLRFLLKEII